MKIEEKKQIIKKLCEKIEKAKVIIATDYKGLNVESINKLRRNLKNEDIEYIVVKNKLFIKSAEETEAAAINKYFKGPTAVAFSYKDPVAPARILVDFIKENDKLSLKGGLLDDKIIDVTAIKALSDLPSREVLLGKLLATVNSVPTTFVTILSEIPKKFLNLLNAIQSQKETA